MKRGCPDHPKTIAFARTLGVPRYAAVGLLEMLWHWTAKYAPRGDVGRFSDGQLAEAVSWTDDPAKLVSALVETRWLDAHNKHRLIIHDWQHHADDTTRKYLSRHGLSFIDSVRTKSRQSRDKVGHISEGSPDSVAPAVAVVSAVAVAKPLPLPEPPETDNGAMSVSPSQASVTDYELESCNSSKGKLEPVPMEQRPEYAEAVREAFAAKTNRATYLIAGADEYWVKRWMDDGVKLSVVLTAIRETRGVGHKLAYYNSSVMTEHERVRLALSGTR